MALLLSVDRVTYKCTCGKMFPLCKLYLCKYCRELRCKLCLSHEPDNYYCSHCMDNIAAPEVKEHKNQCTNCNNCPSCGHALSPRMTTVQTPNPDDPKGEPLQRRLYYLSCTCCRWSTRDAGLPDAPQVAGSWGEKVNKDSTEKVDAVMKYYATVALEEQIEFQTKKYPRRKSFVFKRDLFRRRRSSVLQNLAKHSMINPSAMVGETAQKAADIQPTFTPKFEVAALPESYWTQPLNVSAVTSLQQRLVSPAHLPETASDLYPKRRTLTIKKSLRCRVPDCDHNLIKPEYIPQSIKFKLHLVALLFVPEIRIAHQPHLTIDEESTCVFTLTNPSDSPVSVRLEPISLDNGQPDKYGEIMDELNAELDIAPVLRDAPGIEIGGKVSALEFVDTLGEDSQYKDDPGVVVSRRANKLHVKTTVTPTALSEKIMVGLTMHFQLISDVLLPKDSSGNAATEQMVHPMSTNILIDLGYAH